jgi:hypothetical protein
MIHMLSRYLYECERNKQYWLTRAEKRRAMLLLCGITLCVTITVLLWLLR